MPLPEDGGVVMFIMSMKMSRKKLAAVIITAVVLLGAVALFAGGKLVSSRQISTNSSLSVTSSADAADYVRSFGWEIDAEPSEVVDVAVPTEFNDVYTNYNTLQQQQGFDLEPFKGMQAKRYTFNVKNYPDHPDYIKADVIVCEGQIIAADICSVEIDGFMQGMAKE